MDLTLLLERKKLNVEVAEKILGCRVQHPEQTPMCGCDRPWPHAEGYKEYCADLKDYSCNIKHAWDVVEAMQDRGCMMLSEVSQGKKITFSKDGWLWSATGETVPEAICKAALLVVAEHQGNCSE